MKNHAFHVPTPRTRSVGVSGTRGAWGQAEQRPRAPCLAPPSSPACELAAPRTVLAQGQKRASARWRATDGHPVGVAGFAPLCPSLLPCVWWVNVSTHAVSLNHWLPRSPVSSDPAPRLTSICPFSAASCRGVPPQESRVTGAPISSSRSRMGVWPPRAAKCRAVAPSLSRAVRLMSVKVTWGRREGRGSLRLAGAEPR